MTSPADAPWSPQLAPWSPQFAQRAHLLRDLGPDGGLSAEADAAWREPFGPPEDWDLQIVDREIEGRHGPIPVRIYTPRTPAPAGGRATLLWIHGGSFQHGDLDMPEAHEVSRGVAGRADAVVVSVFYRLCDEPDGTPALNPHGDRGVHAPIPLDDVHDAVRWVRSEATALGVDPERVAVGGASAGGNLAAALSLRLADEGAGPWQSLLMYPAVHIEMPEPDAEEAAALAACAPMGGFPAEAVALMGENYIGRPRTEASGEDFAPLAPRHDHLPPTLIDVAEFDGLRPSGRAYARQLEAAGVEVELALSRGVPHGHLNRVGLLEAAESMDRMAQRLRRPSITAPCGAEPGSGLS